MYIAPRLLASLDPPESNLPVYHRQDATADLTWTNACVFRHSGWRHTRERVYQAMSDTDQPFSAQYEFRHCGSHAYVLQSLDDPTVFRVAGSSCHHRFCLPCANERSRSIAMNVQEHLGRKRARFLTLTLRSTTESLGELLTKLSTCFSRLRRRAIWKKRVTGGVAFIEIKWSATRERWNVHLHAVVQGKYIEVGLLSQAWKHITSDSLIVDIRAIKDNRTVTRYVTKYACKPLHYSVLHDNDKLREAILALKGRRLAITFGDWRGVLLTTKPDEEAWTNLGSLESMIAKAANGEPDAQRICSTLNVHVVTSSTPIQRSRAPPASISFPPVQLELPMIIPRTYPDPLE